MCDNCKCEELKDTEQEIIQEEISDEDLMALMSQIKGEVKEEPLFFRDPIEFDDEEMTVLSNTKEFIEGQALGCRLAGMYSTLINFGVEMNQAMDIIFNQQTIEHNLEVQKLSSEMNKEMSKNQLIISEKNQL